MTTLHRWVRAVSAAGILISVGAGFGGSSLPRTGVPEFTAAVVAEQLGITIDADSADVEFGIGSELTGILKEPARLATFGITGMHTGARVTVLRLSYDRVLIEASEPNPPIRKSIKIRISANGGLVAPPA